MSDYLFSLVDLSIGYSKESPILSNINLTVFPKEIIAITGKNGSGKSTLLANLRENYKDNNNVIFL